MSANGTITLGQNVDPREDPTRPRAAPARTHWRGRAASIVDSNGVVINGNAIASAPSGTACNATSSNYSITGGTVVGPATACGKITVDHDEPVARHREHPACRVDHPQLHVQQRELLRV